AVGEANVDVDPIRLNGNPHAYLQGSIDLGLVGLAQVCKGNFYVRAVDTSAAGASDLDVGAASACVPADANGDGVPDIIVVPGGCTADAECPGLSICADGACVLGVPCIDDTDCASTEQCSPDGFCVAKPAGTCKVTADCNGLVCTSGTCVACAFGG